MHKRWNAACAVMMALAPLSVSEAMQQEVDRPQLCSMSDAVLVADVADLEATWAPGAAGGIERIVQLDVRETLRGRSSSALQLTLPGGRIGELWQWVEDVPALEEGARYLIFLDHTDAGWRVVGGEGGAVRISSSSSWLGEPLAQAVASIGGCDVR